MKVIWTPEAEQDRTDIRDRIAGDNRSAASRMDRRFGDAEAKLTDFPMLGRAGKVPGTRELIPHENYRLVYEVQGDTVWILALIHTAANGHRQRTDAKGL